MSTFWPSDLNLSDTQSPREILEVAQQDWYTSSEGVMELVLQNSESESGNSMIIVHAKHVPSDRTSRVLSIVHRPHDPYPVTIQPEVETLPNFLKKSYNRFNIAQAAHSSLERDIQVSNSWVSDTPSEFRKKLAEAFNQGDIKSKILNLALVASDSPGDTNGKSAEHSVEN